MHLTLLVVLVCLSASSVRTYTLYKWILDSKMRFNYDPDPRNALGVSNWPFTYPENCGGIHQSPIDIRTDHVRYGVAYSCPNMVYKETNLHGELKNNGHSTTFEPESEMVIKLSNIPYRNGTYYFNDFHLHYGGIRGRNFELQGLRFRGSGGMSAGSEHTIDGLRFEGELHFVFYNGKYGSLEMAEKEKDGVAIIVIMVQKVPDMMVEDMKFSKFLEKNIPYVSPYLANVSTIVDISMFFNRACEFYTYTGSTTTPVCHESVRWMILKNPLQVTERAWFLLTRLRSRGDFNSRFGNYRTTQPLNDRVVEANFQREDAPALPMPDAEIIGGLQGNISMVPMIMPFESTERGGGHMFQMDVSSAGPNTYNQQMDRILPGGDKTNMLPLAVNTFGNFPFSRINDIPNAFQMSGRIFEAPGSMQMIQYPMPLMVQHHPQNMPSFKPTMEMGLHRSTQLSGQNGQNIHTPRNIDPSMNSMFQGRNQLSGSNQISEPRMNPLLSFSQANSLLGTTTQNMEVQGVQLPGALFQRQSIKPMENAISDNFGQHQTQDINVLAYPSVPGPSATSTSGNNMMSQMSYPPTQFMTNQLNRQEHGNVNNNNNIDQWMMYLEHMMSKHGTFPKPL